MDIFSYLFVCWSELSIDGEVIITASPHYIWHIEERKVFYLSEIFHCRLSKEWIDREVTPLRNRGWVISVKFQQQLLCFQFRREEERERERERERGRSVNHNTAFNRKKKCNKFYVTRSEPRIIIIKIILPERPIFIFTLLYWPHILLYFIFYLIIPQYFNYIFLVLLFALRVHSLLLKNRRT